MAALAAREPQDPAICMHHARSCSATQILRAGNPARRICMSWRVAWHVALDNGPARPVTIRYLIIIYDIYIISIRTVCNAGTVFYNTELAGRAGACMHATQYVHT